MEDRVPKGSWKRKGSSRKCRFVRIVRRTAILACAAMLFCSSGCGKPSTKNSEIQEAQSIDGFPGMPSPDDVERAVSSFLSALRSADRKKIMSFRNPVLTGESSNALWGRDDATTIISYLCRDITYQNIREISEKEYRKTKFGKPYTVYLDIFARDQSLLPNVIYAQLDGTSFQLQKVLDQNPYILYTVRNNLPFRHTEAIDVYPSRNGKIYLNVSEILMNLTGFQMSESADAYDAKQAVVVSMLDKNLTDELHVGLDQIPDGLPLSPEDIQKLHLAFSDKNIVSAVERVQELCKNYHVICTNADKVVQRWNNLTDNQKNEVNAQIEHSLAQTNVALSKSSYGSPIYVELRECGSLTDTNKGSGLTGTKSFVVHIQISSDKSADEVLREVDDAVGTYWYSAAMDLEN